MFALRHVCDQSFSPPLALDLSLVLTLAAAKRREKRRQRSRPSVAIKAETHIFSFRNKPQGTSAVLVSRFVVILVSHGTIGCPTGDQRATHAQRFRFWIPFSLSLSLSLCLLDNRLPATPQGRTSSWTWNLWLSDVLELFH